MADFLRDGVDTNSVYIGAMAQDLLDIVPDAVATNPKTGTMMLIILWLILTFARYREIDVDVHLREVKL